MCISSVPIWHLTVECPTCASSNVRHVTASVERTLNTTSSAVIECADCGVEWLLEVNLSPVRDRLPRPGFPVHRERGQCGTERGYQRHRTDQTERCDACKAAHADHNSPLPERNRGRVA